MDRDELDNTYAGWRETAEQRTRELADVAIDVYRVEVDVESLWAWCCAQGRPLDGAARAEFAAILGRNRGGESGLVGRLVD